MRDSSTIVYVGGFLVLVGVLAPLLAVEDLQVAYHSSPEPQRMQCWETEHIKPNENRYVTLTDAWPCPFMYEAQSVNSPWQMVLVPVGPPAGEDEFAEPSGIRVIVQSREIQNDNDLERFFETGELTGVLKSRGWCTEPILKAENPGIQLDKCWKLEPGDSPGTTTFPAVVITLGTLMFSGGVLLAFVVTDHLGPGGSRSVNAGTVISLGVAAVLHGMRSASVGTVSAILLVCGPGFALIGGLLFYQYLTMGEGWGYLGVLLFQIGLTLLCLAGYLLFTTKPDESNPWANDQDQAGFPPPSGESAGPSFDPLPEPPMSKPPGF